MPALSRRPTPATETPTSAPAPGLDRPAPAPAPAPRGNAHAQELLLAQSAEVREADPTQAAGAAPDWVAELLEAAPLPSSGGGQWAGVIAQLQRAVPEAPAPSQPFQLPAGARVLVGADGRLRVWPGLQADAVAARLAAAGMTLEDLRPMAEAVQVAPAPSPSPAQSPEPAPTAPPGGPARAGAGTPVSERGAADLNRMANAASRPWYGQARGKCYRAVAGYDSGSYMNRAGGRWKALADRIPGDHAMWAVSFAHWLQETSHGRRAAAELGFTILESDGKTRLGDFLAARPDLRGSIVVVPFGQQGTASQEWNAAAHYGAKWGKGVGDISVVTEIGGRGATYVADGPVQHDQATMWWVVHPR